VRRGAERAATAVDERGVHPGCLGADAAKGMVGDEQDFVPPHPCQFGKNGVAASTRPDCMSTTVPYWSNVQTLMVDLTSCGSVMAVSVGAAMVAP
jgi:hypothetical protein